MLAYVVLLKYFIFLPILPVHTSQYKVIMVWRYSTIEGGKGKMFTTNKGGQKNRSASKETKKPSYKWTKKEEYSGNIS